MNPIGGLFRDVYDFMLYLLNKDISENNFPIIDIVRFEVNVCRDVACYVSTRPYFICSFKKNEDIIFSVFLRKKHKIIDVPILHIAEKFCKSLICGFHGHKVFHMTLTIFF